MLPPIDLNRYPLHAKGSTAYRSLVERCQRDLERDGMFNLEGFMTSESIVQTVTAVAERLTPEAAYVHARTHNIYFKNMPELPHDHAALKEAETRNLTLCADQCAGLPIEKLYAWQPFADFLAETLEQGTLFPMADPLARFNIMGYPEGWELNWHFDRSQFTTTLLLQAPDEGGEFEYRSDLRSDNDPNYDGVAKLLRGDDPKVKSISAQAGTLNVFKGRNTAHRVTPVVGDKARIVAVLTYYDRPGANFSREERLGFYGRAE